MNATVPSLCSTRFRPVVVLFPLIASVAAPSTTVRPSPLIVPFVHVPVACTRTSLLPVRSPPLCAYVVTSTSGSPSNCAVPLPIVSEPPVSTTESSNTPVPPVKPAFPARTGPAIVSEPPSNVRSPAVSSAPA